MSAEQETVQSFYNTAIGLQPNAVIENDPILKERFSPWIMLGNLLHQCPPKLSKDQRILFPRKKLREHPKLSMFYTAEEGVKFFGYVYNSALTDPNNVVDGNAITGTTFEIHGTDAEKALTDGYIVPLESGRVPDTVFQPLWTALSKCAAVPLPNGAGNPRVLRREGYPVRATIYADVPPALEQNVMELIRNKTTESTARAVLERIVQIQEKYQTGKAKYPMTP